MTCQIWKWKEACGRQRGYARCSHIEPTGRMCLVPRKEKNASADAVEIILRGRNAPGKKGIRLPERFQVKKHAGEERFQYVYLPRVLNGWVSTVGHGLR